MSLRAAAVRTVPRVLCQAPGVRLLTAPRDLQEPRICPGATQPGEPAPEAGGSGLELSLHSADSGSGEQHRCFLRGLTQQARGLGGETKGGKEGGDELPGQSASTSSGFLS